MNKALERSRLITDRFKTVTKNGELTTADQMAILSFLFNRLNLLPIADSARKKGVSYQAIKKRIDARSEMFVKIGTQTFVESATS